MGKTTGKTEKQDDMVPWNFERVMDSYYSQINERNKNIETYSKLCNSAQPILEKYASYFKTISVYHDNISLTLKDKCQIPPIYCECDLAGLSAIYKESSCDQYIPDSYSRSNLDTRPKYETIITRKMEIRLK